MGVPQGSVLGPLLITLYVRDLPSCVDVKVLMFADDILLFFSGFSIPEIACRLTNAVISLVSWLTTRGLQMNIGKTQAMFVLPRGLNISPDTVVMCNSRPLQLVTAYKYLGVFLDNRLSCHGRLRSCTSPGKSRKRLGPCYALVSNWRYLPNDYSTWPSLLPISNMVRTVSIRLFPPLWRKSLFASPSVVSEQFSELHLGRQ